MISGSNILSNIHSQIARSFCFILMIMLNKYLAWSILFILYLFLTNNSPELIRIVILLNWSTKAC